MDKTLDYLWDNYRFQQFFNNFLVLLVYKIDIYDVFKMVDFFWIFIISRITEILIVLKFSLGVYR